MIRARKTVTKHLWITTVEIGIEAYCFGKQKHSLNSFYLFVSIRKMTFDKIKTVGKYYYIRTIAVVNLLYKSLILWPSSISCHGGYRSQDIRATMPRRVLFNILLYWAMTLVGFCVHECANPLMNKLINYAF